MALVSDRYDEAYILDIRNNRVDTFSQWKDRISSVDMLIRGDWTQAQVGNLGGDPVIMNIADQFPRDVARLACEVTPSFKAPAIGDSDEQERNANIREIIGEGYFAHGRFDLIRPLLVMDMVISGTAFVVYWIDPTRAYPRMMRVDPRNAFPDVYNGEIQDLLVTSTMKARVADRLWPHLGILDILAKTKDTPDEVEIWDYFSREECVKYVGVVGLSGDGISAQLVESWSPHTDRVPVSFAQMPSPDGAFRGLEDQIGNSLAAKNRAVNLLLEYSDQMVYSPFESKGVLNPDSPPGPDTIYQHDPAATTETFMRRVAPAGSSPQVFGLVQYLDDEQRKQLAYPASRQGDIGVSQGSAAYVQSTMGQLTSLVREVDRLLADMQEQGSAICFQLDRLPMMDFEKPLIRSLGRKKTYKPSRDIPEGVYGMQVSYGAGAGLDRLNTDVRLLQFYSAGLLSAEKVLGETDFVAEAKDEIDRREKEEIRRIILQRFAGDPTVSLDFIIRAYEIQRDTGVSLVDAYVEATKEMAAQPQAPVPGTPEAMQPPPGPEEPGMQQEALQKGATQPQGAPAIAGQFSPPPIEQVLVR